MMQRKQLGLVGLGRFGRFAARHLRERADIVAADARDVSADAVALGIRTAPLDEVASCPVVVFAVPIQSLRASLRAAAPHVRPGALVADVCSVKVEPLRWMSELLPESVEIVGTHPLFGPQSAEDGLQGHAIVVCPERTTRNAHVCHFLESLGLEVIVSDADTHDRQCAYTQALAQYVGRAINDLEGTDTPISTPAARLLREAARMVADDSWELFSAIQRFNPYAIGMRQDLRRRLDDLDARMSRER